MLEMLFKVAQNRHLLLRAVSSWWKWPLKNQQQQVGISDGDETNDQEEMPWIENIFSYQRIYSIDEEEWNETECAMI